MTRPAILALSGGLALAIGLTTLAMGARAQSLTPTAQPNVTTLLNSGYTIVAASADGAAQYIYLQGSNAKGRKTAYACELQFGQSGGFRGCIALP